MLSLHRQSVAETRRVHRDHSDIGLGASARRKKRPAFSNLYRNIFIHGHLKIPLYLGRRMSVRA